MNVQIERHNMEIIDLSEFTSGSKVDGKRNHQFLQSGSLVNMGLWTIEPGEETLLERHDDTEVLVILSGKGAVKNEDNKLDIAAGKLVIFDSFDSHTIRNTGIEKLVFISFYWRDKAHVIEKLCQEVESSKPDTVFVTSTPPTPNGDLHLGHLSGPYLGADVHTRFLKMSGIRAFHICGSDDHQSYTAAKAYNLKISPFEVASKFSGEIRKTLAALDISIDRFYEPRMDNRYSSMLINFLKSMLESGSIYSAEKPATFDRATGQYAYEVNIRGNCRICGNLTGGNICEECGHPNQCTDLDNLVSQQSNSAPDFQNIHRLHFKLSGYIDEVRRHHAKVAMAPRVSSFLEQLSVFDPAVTHPGGWGIPAPGVTDQIVWVWYEMAFGLLYAISTIDEQEDVSDIQIPENSRIVHFFGFDNTFYHTVLFPAIYLSAFGVKDLPIDYCYNEFFLLDQEKFSTSRNHAIWGREILGSSSVDAVRFALAYERPETMRTDFTLDRFQDLVNCILIEEWQQWLHGLDQRAEEEWNGKTPVSGLWTNAHREFVARLEEYPRRLARSYSVHSFSLRRVARDLCNLVRDAQEFGEIEQHWSSASHHKPYRRTVFVLELSAARVLAQLAAPLMPSFCQTLWIGLGLAGSPTGGGWPTQVFPAELGDTISLNSDYFGVPR